MSVPDGHARIREAVFTRADLEQLAARGIARAEAERQLALLARPDHFVRLLRPCTAGDGILVLEPAERARHEAAGAEAVAAGRCTRFIPASGAASRMFADLERARAAAADEGAAGSGSGSLAAFLAGAPRLALWGELAAVVARRGGDAERLRAAGDGQPLLEALLDPDGMDAGSRPKGLLPFHREGGEVRTAFDEQLAELAAQGADRDGVARAHFTVPASYRAAFEAGLDAARPRFPGVRLEVGFSEQMASTDTLAADPSGAPFRLEDGTLLLRPAGHGALIENLNALGADLVLVKNIDNVTPARLRAPTLLWSRVLFGLLAEAEAGCRTWLRRLTDAPANADLDGAAAFLAGRFGESEPAPGGDRLGALVAALARPIRVCGMVRNTGEPGGGPYYVSGGQGPQIVESAQADLRDPEQARIFRAATHFNPVFMACALRDPEGRLRDLRPYVDPQAVIVTQKSAGGRALRALERPGLWNGAMARWNAIFVEVPGGVFHPVKTLFDLLRPEHQPIDTD